MTRVRAHRELPEAFASEHAVTERDAIEGVFPEAPAREGAVLVFRHAGATRVVELALGAEISIGRLPESSLCVDSPRVSRRHAVIRRTPSGVEIEDLGTPNGTRVNGETIAGAKRLLAGGDVVSVGPSEVLLAVLPAPGAEAAQPLEQSGPDSTLEGFPGTIAADPAMIKIFRTARRLAGTPTTVLITGETGVGKEVVAEYMHRASARAAGPFVRLNCASLPEALLESELFGHERGAFTGADKRKIGYFEAAEGGTLLLDEIGEMPLGLQVKLLRVLENRRISRLGSTQEISIGARIVCATHRDLAAEVSAGRFRQDLFYRISTFTLRVPPLRERPSEIALIAKRFAGELAAAMGAKPPPFAADAVEALTSHRWPGNVRELRNAVEHGVILAEDGVLRAEHLPETVFAGGSQDVAPGSMRALVSDVEKKTIEEALTAEDGSRTRAAKRLGISRRALIYKVAKYKIDL